MRSKRKQGRRNGHNQGFTRPRQIDTGVINPKTGITFVVDNDRGLKKRLVRAATKIYILIEAAMVRAYHAARSHGAGLSKPPRRYEQDEMTAIMKPVAKKLTVEGIAKALKDGTLAALLGSVADAIGPKAKAEALAAA